MANHIKGKENKYNQPLFKRYGIAYVFVSGIAIYSSLGIAQHFKPSRYKEKIELQCGQHKMVLACGKARPEDFHDPSEERVCVRNSLDLVYPNGTHKRIPTPKNYLENQGTPAGLECHQGKDLKRYWVITYNFSLTPADRLHDVYTEKGRRLTIYEKRADHEYDRVAGELDLQPISKTIFIEEQK